MLSVLWSALCPWGRGTAGRVGLWGNVEVLGLDDITVVIVGLVHVGSLHVVITTCWCGPVLCSSKFG